MHRTVWIVGGLIVICVVVGCISAADQVLPPQPNPSKQHDHTEESDSELDYDDVASELDGDLDDDLGHVSIDYAQTECDQNQYLPPPGAARESILLVSTVDGRLTALDLENEGDIMWSVNVASDKLMTGNLQNMELLGQDQNLYRIIPTLDGYLYTYNAQGVLSPMPVNSQALLSNSVRFGDDVLSGGKHVNTYGLDVKTGEVLYACTMDGCDRSQESADLNNNIVLKRVRQTVRAVDCKSGQERWNVSVSEQFIELARAGAAQPDEAPRRHPGVQILPAEGRVLGISAAGAWAWSAKLASPVAAAWRWSSLGLSPTSVTHDAQLHPVSLFDPTVVPDLNAIRPAAIKPDKRQRGTTHDNDGAGSCDADNTCDAPAPDSSALTVYFDPDMHVDMLLYLGTYEKSPYIILSARERQKLLATTYQLAQMKAAEQLAKYQQHVNDGSVVPTEVTGTELQPYVEEHQVYLAHDSQVELFLRSLSSLPPMHQHQLLQYAADKHSGCRPGYCQTCSADQQAGAVDVEPVAGGNQEGYTDEQCSVKDVGWFIYRHKAPVSSRSPSAAAVADKLIEAAASREANLLTAQFWLLAFISISLSGLALTACLKRLFWLRRPKSVSSRSISVSVSTSMDLEELVEDNLQLGEEADGATTVQTQASFPDSLPDNRPYVSRFVTDFVPICSMGRGGFGVVFECENRMDEVHYAVKRVKVPNSTTARDKVMREVKSLAKLDHVGIVRYYQAWIEQPPSGWQTETDKELFSKCHSRQDGVPSTQDELFGGAGGSWTTETSSSLAAANNNNLTGTQLVNRKHRRSAAKRDDSLLGEIDRRVFGGQIEFSSDTNQTDAETSTAAESTTDDIVFEHDGSCSLAASASSRRGQLPTNSQSAAHQPMKHHQATSLSSVCTFERSSDSAKRDVLVQAEQPDHAPVFLYIQMQLCTCTLRDWLHVNASRDRSHQLDWYRQIVQAVAYVHAQGIIHRDLKPSNIFLTADSRLKIGDFGLATDDLMQKELQLENAVEDNEADSKTADHNNLTNNVGTRLYMSPEQMSGGGAYTTKVDVFSLGIVFLELLITFRTQMERATVLGNAKRQQLPANAAALTPTDLQLVGQLCCADPAVRPTCQQILDFMSKNYTIETKSL